MNCITHLPRQAGFNKVVIRKRSKAIGRIFNKKENRQTQNKQQLLPVGKKAQSSQQPSHSRSDEEQSIQPARHGRSSSGSSMCPRTYLRIYFNVVGHCFHLVMNVFNLVVISCLFFFLIFTFILCDAVCYYFNLNTKHYKNKKGKYVTPMCPCPALQVSPYQ